MLFQFFNGYVLVENSKLKKFYILFFITLILFIFNFKVPYNNVKVIVQGKLSPSEIQLKINNEKIPFEKKGKFLEKNIGQKIDDFKIVTNKENKIDAIIIFNGSRINYFNNLDEFEKINGEYKVPNKVRWNENFKSYNFRSVLNLISAFFFSFFSINSILPYFMGFFTIFYYLKNKDEIKLPKLNGFFIFVILFILGAIFRLNGLFEYHLHLDEYFSIYYSNPKLPFDFVFEDAGNPPLFYILFKFYLKIFDISFYSTKLFPFLASLFGIFFLWLFLKKEFSLKTANLGLFLAIFNLPLIMYSNEIRSYILQIAIVPLLIWNLFKIIETNKIKFYFSYFVLFIIASNLHYYMVLFLIFNFIYIGFYFIKNKKYNDFLKFFNINLFASLFFIMFLSKTGLEFGMNNSSFNSWIVLPDIQKIKTTVFYIFNGAISSLLSLVFFIKSLFNHKKTKNDEIIIYLFSLIVFVLISSILISYFIKPIFVERYFALLYPVFIIFLTLVFSNSYKNKYIIFLFTIWFLLIQNFEGEKSFKLMGIIDYPIYSSYEISKISNKNIYAISNLASDNLEFHYKNSISKNVKYIQVLALSFENSVNEILKEDKNALILTVLIDKKKIKGKIEEFYNPSTKTSLFKITN